MIYRDFDHWFSTSEVHGFSSASKEFARELWEDLRPTMEGSHDDFKLAYLELAKRQAKERSILVDALLNYIEEHKKPGEVGFWRWWLNKAISNRDESGRDEQVVEKSPQDEH